jgi:hypothetical protein
VLALNFATAEAASTRAPAAVPAPAPTNDVKAIAVSASHSIPRRDTDCAARAHDEARSVFMLAALSRPI